MEDAVMTIGRFGGWAERKTDENGDPLDKPRRPKADVGYVRPPSGLQICCETCVHFREPDECAEVGNKGAIIYPEGCCNLWTNPEALASTFDDPNPGDEESSGKATQTGLKNEDDEEEDEENGFDGDEDTYGGADDGFSSRSFGGS